MVRQEKTGPRWACQPCPKLRRFCSRDHPIFMYKRNVLFILICLCASLAGKAQTPAPSPNSSSSKNGTFQTLAAKLKGGDTTVDFKALRMASVDSNDEDAGVEADQDAY